MRKWQRRLMNRVVAGILSVGGLALLAMGLRSLSRLRTVQRQRGRATTADAAFIMAALDHHAGTIALGETAGVRADHVEVRDFAQLLAERHTQALTDLEELAGYLGVGVEPTPPGSTRRLVRHLQGETGIRVDQAFLRHVIDDHREVLTLYEEAARNAASPDVQAYAQALVPHLQAHLRVAEELDRHMSTVAAR
jgi:putative membrane protein